MPTLSNPAPLVLVAQPVHAPIGEPEMLAALTADEAANPRRVVSIDTKDACEAAIASRDWGPVDQAIRTQFEERLRPMLGESVDATLHYFGAAPIPTAM